MVRLKGGDTFNINLCDTDDPYGDVMTGGSKRCM